MDNREEPKAKGKKRETTNKVVRNIAEIMETIFSEIVESVGLTNKRQRVILQKVEKSERSKVEERNAKLKEAISLSSQLKIEHLS